MNRARPSRLERLCRALLRVYPAAIRARDGEELLQLVRDLQRDVRGGALARARLASRIVLDLLFSGLAERIVALSPSTRSWLAFGAVAVALSALGGFVDLRSRPVQPAAACLLLSAAVLSAARPRRFWFAALVVGAGVPVASLLARAFGWPVAYHNPNASGFDYFVPFLPALIGALLGAGVRLMVGPRGGPRRPAVP
jgi:hypothetical protein